MTIIDRLDVPQVVKFTQGFLADYRTTFPRNRKLGRSLTIELKTMRRDAKRELSGRCLYNYKPKGEPAARMFLIRVRVNSKNRYPVTHLYPVGTEAVEDDSSAYRYLMESVRMTSEREVTAFVVGHELYHFLRKTGQVGGQNRQTQANKFGIKFLRDFRQKNGMAATAVVGTCCCREV